MQIIQTIKTVETTVPREHHNRIMNRNKYLNSNAKPTTWLPSPENSELIPFFADQTWTEFLGEGLGVRVPGIASQKLPEAIPVAKLEIQNNFNRSLFPLTPNPSPREFGQRLIPKRSVEFRIHGERGAS